jgi:hypothetical protein
MVIDGDGGESSHHFDNARFEQAVTRLQNGDTNALGEIIKLSQRRALALIRYNGTHHYCGEDELLSDVNYKLLRAVRGFNPSKGSAFTFVSKVIDSTLRTRVTTTRRHWARHVELNDEITTTLRAKEIDHSNADELANRIRSKAKTLLMDTREIEAQKWYVDSFMVDGFDSKRHACADACMGVFQLSHVRSRELFDLTMLEVRRALYGDVKRHEQIAPGRLLGTRAHWMAEYSPLLSAEEFTKFVVLMRNLAPYLLLLVVDSTKANNHRRNRNPGISRKNLERILYGCPDAMPLFRELKYL